jgi:hypothetical protein
MVGINYLSRDILFVGYPSDAEYGRGITHFLEEYINPTGGLIIYILNIVS